MKPLAILTACLFYMAVGALIGAVAVQESQPVYEPVMCPTHAEVYEDLDLLQQKYDHLVWNVENNWTGDETGYVIQRKLIAS